MKKINTPNYKLFLNMILPFACVLLVPTMVWIISNLYAMNANEDKVVSLVAGNIERRVDVIDSNLTQVENIVMQISQNTAFDDFYSKKKLLYAEQMKLQKILSSYHLENGVTQNIYMYSSTSGIVIDNNGIYNNAYEFYRYKCGFGEEISQDWAQHTEDLSHFNGYSFD